MSTKERPDQITDQDRYPTLSEHGQALLRFLREHPNAPIFRNQSGLIEVAPNWGSDQYVPSVFISGCVGFHCRA